MYNRFLMIFKLLNHFVAYKISKFEMWIKPVPSLFFSEFQVSWIVISTKDPPKWNLQSPMYLEPVKRLSIFNFSVNKWMSFPLSILWSFLKKNEHTQK